MNVKKRKQKNITALLRPLFRMDNYTTTCKMKKIFHGKMGQAIDGTLDKINWTTKVLDDTRISSTNIKKGAKKILEKKKTLLRQARSQFEPLSSLACILRTGRLLGAQWIGNSRGSLITTSELRLNKVYLLFLSKCPMWLP